MYLVLQLGRAVSATRKHDAVIIGFMEESSTGLRNRRDHSESDAAATVSTTTQALKYEPGAIRIRLTTLKDILLVLRARYMQHVFQLAGLVLIIQLGYAAKSARSGGLTVDGLIHTPVMDACALLSQELFWALPAFAAMAVAFMLRRGNSVYLLDFALYDPPDSWKQSKENILELIRRSGGGVQSGEAAGAAAAAASGTPPFTESDVTFMGKVLANSGTGDATAWPPGIVKLLDADAKPGALADESMQACRNEAETVVCGALESLFERTGVKPKEVDFLVINCSLFSPTPSLCAMACNKFRMRSNVRTYNLSGMGCSASLLAVDLASELLQNNPNSIAVVVSTESITQSLYHGHEKSMLLQNTLFRCGGAALLLTNKPRLLWRAKYRLRHLVRTQCSDDESYRSVFQCEDGDGHSGVRLSKEIVKVAGNAMKINLTQLGPLILPLSEQLKVVYSIVTKKLGLAKDAPKYVPSFKSAIHYFCIHSGGRAVLDGIEKNLRLTPKDMEPSRAVLYARGNTSSSSIWYELRHIEENMSIKRGHKVLQLAFGSGFKCNSAVWTCLR